VAGSWVDIRFPSAEFPVGKTYSFSSSPTEPDLMISFKKGISKFKQALVAVKPGDTMVTTQHGSKGFILDKYSPAVLIAGGIGIAPFRSMIKELIDSKQRCQITLVYFNRNDDFPFKHELNEWQKELAGFKIIYAANSDGQKVNKAKVLQATPRIYQSIYYIAGPPGMVESIEHTLIDMGVKTENIRLDSFDGY